MKNWLPVLLIALLALVYAAEKNTVSVEMNASGAQPRQVEDVTEKAITRDYANAWKIMETALSENRTDQLGSGFAGVAQDNLEKRIEGQRASNLKIRIVDHGHKLDAIFYSPEGSALQVRDTAQLEIEYLNGNSVVHREQVTQKYLALLTVGEDRWKVRVLEEVPQT
jgi:hypothetical protein